MKKKLNYLKLAIQVLLLPPLGHKRLNIIKTVYYNFYCLPFHQAKKFPIWIFAKTKIYKLGKIEIRAEIKPGMILIGKRGSIFQNLHATRILNKGIMIFEGKTDIEHGVAIVNLGKITFGGYIRCASNCRFFITTKLSIGKYARLGFGCFFVDTDFHYMINVESGEIKNYKREIVIGNACWIGSDSTIKKGCVLPDYTIVASNSVLTKDYTEQIPPYSIIGGVPAKLITSGYRRVFNKEKQKKLTQYFKENKNTQSITVDLKSIDIEKYCMENAL